MSKPRATPVELPLGDVDDTPIRPRADDHLDDAHRQADELVLRVIDAHPGVWLTAKKIRAGVRPWLTGGGCRAALDRLTAGSVLAHQPGTRYGTETIEGTWRRAHEN